MSKNDHIPIDLDTKAPPFKTNKQSLRMNFFIEHDFRNVPDITHNLATGSPTTYIKSN